MRIKPYLILVLIGLSACGDSTAPSVPKDGNTLNPNQRCVHYQADRQPFFGDLHVHTKYSLDANTQGTVTSPHDAYRFAIGERIGIQPFKPDGTPLRTTQIARQLDFAAVTDHAELFGETEVCTNPDYVEYNLPECQFYRANPEQAFVAFNFSQIGSPSSPGPDGKKRVPRMAYCGVNGATCLEAAKTPWRDIQRAALAYNDTSKNCTFTTFVGYEYTASPQSNNLHRNVIFKTDIVPELPPSYQEYPAPEFLWRELATRCKDADGCNYLTIPHNSNLSAGLMFKTQDDSGANYTQEFARLRQENEPLAEIYQHKGQSECLSTMGAGANDEQCRFEVIPYNNLTGDRFGGLNTGPAKEQDYLREALKEGLRLQTTIGANPFKYGLIGSSDTHIGTPGNTIENNFPGHGGAGASARTEAPKGLTDLIEYSPGGLAVLWAEENTRDSLFKAMRRKEAYATSGIRPVVRFFAGANLPADLCSRPDFVAQGYQLGVPMGSDLAASPTSPRFAVLAFADLGAEGEPVEPLQRIQIVKGWVDNGVKHEVVVDVAGNGQNGATVDPNTCETRGSGFSNLCAVWQDPQYNPAQHAFYYARILNNPSCRWSTQQCIAGGVDCSQPNNVPAEFADCCNASYPKTIQERAWTSPIWIQPAAP